MDSPKRKYNVPLSLKHVYPMATGPSGTLTLRVVRHLEDVLAKGTIEPGGRLPSERTLAADLGVSRNTVTAAYDELEQRGLIRRLRGKGAFMCSPRGKGGSFAWSGKVSSAAHLLDEPVLDLLARTGASALPYPLSAGTPSLECFPTAIFRSTVNRIIFNDFPRALAVAPTEGQWRLRESIGQWLKVEKHRVMITSGAQEGIDLLCRCLVEPGDFALVESPTYPGALQCLRAAGAQLVSWGTEWSLIELEQLLLRYRPKLIFTTPTFQNPTGRVMPLATREGLIDLAHRYHVPIIEDDVYSKTYLTECQIPASLIRLDQHSQVISVSTFSKMLAPGLRVGWIIAPPYMIKQLSLIKMRANLFTGGFAQLVLADMLDSGNFDRHLAQLRRHHCVLRDAAICAAKTAVSDGSLSFASPAGGLYLWFRVRFGVDMETFLELAFSKGVGVAPGHAFFANGIGERFFRICFTAVSEAGVRSAIEVLRDTLREMQPHRMTEPRKEARAEF